MGIEKLYQRALRPKPVHYINNRRALRPGKYHPDPEHWAALRKQRHELQNGECGTCFESDALELHHRHYDSWGHEELNDIVLLCRPCHEAITSRIRDARYAAGEWKIPPHTRLQVGDTVTRFKAEERAIELKADAEKAMPRFKAESSY